MTFSGLPDFNIEDLTDFNTHGPWDYYFPSNGDSLDPSNIAGPSQPNGVWEGLDRFGGFGLDPSNVTGPSQPYTGVEVWGDLNYPGFPEPPLSNPAPTSLYPTNGVVPGEGYLFPFYYQGAATVPFPLASSFPQGPATTPYLPPTVSPIPTLSWGVQSLPAEAYATPTAPAYHSYDQSQAQVVPTPDGLRYDFFIAAGNLFLPAFHPSIDHNPPGDEWWDQFPQPGPSHLDIPTLTSVTGVAPPELPLPARVASSSGPERTRRRTRGEGRDDPTKSAKKVDPHKDKKGWRESLNRLYTKCDVLYSVQDGQPSGGLVPATALAELDQFVKEDLKQSPLRDTKTGQGERSRDWESYLKCLVSAILPKPVQEEGRSNEEDEIADVLSRVADELEGKLAVVNQRPSLLRPKAPRAENITGWKPEGTQLEKTGEGSEQEAKEAKEAKKREKRNRVEKARRDKERYHLERISRLFRVPSGRRSRLWSKKDVLGLSVIFLLYGSEAFSAGSTQPLSVTQGL